MAATAVDYGLVLGYLAALTVVGAVGAASGVVPDTFELGAGGRVLAQVVVAALLTVPVTVALAGWESRRGATPGKRLLGLRVSTAAGERPGFGRALARSTLKVALPWELAHTAVWNMAAWPGGGGTGLDIGLLVAAYALVGAWLYSLIARPGRTYYDRLAGTNVVVAADHDVRA